MGNRGTLLLCSLHDRPRKRCPAHGRGNSGLPALPLIHLQPCGVAVRRHQDARSNMWGGQLMSWKAGQ